MGADGGLFGEMRQPTTGDGERVDKGGNDRGQGSGSGCGNSDVKDCAVVRELGDGSLSSVDVERTEGCQGTGVVAVAA